MGTSGMRSGWAAGVATLVALAALALCLLDGVALAGKPPPLPSTKLIYYYGSGSWRMASDGSGKTPLPGKVDGRLSDVRFGNTYWSVWQESVAGTRLPGDSEPRTRIVVWPVEVAGGPIVILEDVNWKPWVPTFRPVPTGSAPKVTFAAVHWTGTAFEAGLYEITCTMSGGAITGGDPTTLHRILPGEVFTHVYSNGGINYYYYWSQIQGHDWLNGTKLVYGDDSFSSGGEVWSQLYVYDFANPGTPPLALIATGQPRMVWGPAWSPSGSRVTFGNYTALYEVTTGGNATPTAWVSSTRSKMAGVFDYLEEDYLVYKWSTTTYPPVSDVYRKYRYGSAANLTGDVSTSCIPVTAR